MPLWDVSSALLSKSRKTDRRPGLSSRLLRGWLGLDLHMASDVIVRDLAVMTPAYMMANRLLTLNTKCGIDKNNNHIGTLNYLPHDIVYHIGEIVNTN